MNYILFFLQIVCIIISAFAAAHTEYAWMGVAATGIAAFSKSATASLIDIKKENKND